MATEFEKALQLAKYTALPLPRGKTGPTTIYGFQDGQLFVVRNAQNCLKLPVTVDRSVDTVQFTRQYKFNVSGVAGFLAKLLGIGDAKAELEVRNIASATVQMGGLSHETIETGALVDWLLDAEPSACLRDLLDPKHLTIVAALKASTFSFSFTSSKGASVKVGLKEARGLFQVDAGASVELNESGHIVVTAPAYVGVVAWNGRTMESELKAARKFARSSVGKKSGYHLRPAPSMARALHRESIRAVSHPTLKKSAVDKRRLTTRKPGRFPSDRGAGRPSVAPFDRAVSPKQILQMRMNSLEIAMSSGAKSSPKKQSRS